MAGVTADEREYGNLYPIARAVLTPIFRFCWRLHVRGLQHVPEKGGAIFCPNHTSVIDSFFLPLALPRKITFVGKAEYMDDWKTKYIFPAIGMIPIDRGGGSAAERALNTAARVLQKGEFFGIYPEGTRARDGRLHRGHTGPARLAIRTGVPIIPVGIRGTRDVQPPEATMPKPFRSVEVCFGEPVDPARYAGRADDRMVLRQIIDEVMYEIQAMTGQEYVDEYATKKAPRPDEARDEPAGPSAEVDTSPEPVGTSTNGRGHDDDAPPPRSSADVLARWSST
jgi:1-acyl-sn-glycerol-3-phosphate acyltransferase